MNKTTIVLVVAGVLLAATLVVFTGGGSWFSRPQRELSSDEERAFELLKIAKEVCLSGSKNEASVGLDIETDLTSKIKASTGVKREESKGAVAYLDERVRSIQDDSIRACMQQYLPQIQACLLGDCSSAALPKAVEFRFSYRAPEDNENLLKDQVAFALENRLSNHYLVAQPGVNYYLDMVELEPQGTQRNAAISCVVKESYATATDLATKFCLERSAAVSPSKPPLTMYQCEQGLGCTHDGLSPRWFELCEYHTQRDSVFSLVSAAYADPGDRTWVVPTLETLQQRDDLFGIGYTRFTVESEDPLPVAADGFYWSLTVNGWKTYVDGLPGSFSAQPYDPKTPLKLEFGLQNLNFAGVRNGCDAITLELHFVKDGAPVAGEPVILERSYVALRDARLATFRLLGTTFVWRGAYQRAPREYDTEVFVSSILVSRSLDFDGNRPALERAQRTVSSMKTEFDRMGLAFEGRPLVAVVRPPLTQLSYGLAIGMVEETGQIRFTYEHATAQRLLQFLLDQRSRGSTEERVIRQDSFLYSVRGEESYMASPPVCWND